MFDKLLNCKTTYASQVLLIVANDKDDFRNLIACYYLTFASFFVVCICSIGACSEFRVVPFSVPNNEIVC